jgi:long-subunit acyl-CoA synthetase (AMP-forming)
MLVFRINSSLGLYMEKLLKEIKFPYTVTYGTIETCGIATYSHPNEHKIESVGKPIINGLIEKDNIIYYQNGSE